MLITTHKLRMVYHEFMIGCLLSLHYLGHHFLCAKFFNSFYNGFWDHALKGVVCIMFVYIVDRGVCTVCITWIEIANGLWIGLTSSTNGFSLSSPKCMSHVVRRTPGIKHFNNKQVVSFYDSTICRIYPLMYVHYSS